MHQQRNVFRPFAKWRHVDRKNIQPVIEIAAKLLFFNQLRQVGIGRRHYAHVHSQRARTSESFEFLLLKHAQQFRLQIEWNVLDFVEKDRSLVREFEPTDASIDGAGERAFLMTEQLTLQQACRNRRAIYFDERAFASITQVVDRARDQLFARAGFAVDQNGRVGSRDCLRRSATRA